MSKTTERSGRPAKYPKGERRPTLTFRVRNGLHEKLKEAVTRSQLSLSEEVERRVSLTFTEEHVLGRMVSALAQAGEALTGCRWQEHPETLDVILGMVIQHFMAMRLDPEGAQFAQTARETYQFRLSQRAAGAAASAV